MIIWMNAKLNLALAVAGGFAGGMLSHQFRPAAVHAQSAPAAVIHSAESLRLPVFLVNESGAVAASFTIDADGQPNIRLFDAAAASSGNGGTANAPHAIWSARSEAAVTSPAKP